MFFKILHFRTFFLFIILIFFGCNENRNGREILAFNEIKENYTFETGYDSWVFSGVRGVISPNGRNGGNCLKLLPIGNFSHTIARTLQLSGTNSASLNVEAWILPNKNLKAYIKYEIFGGDYMNEKGGIIKNKKVLTKDKSEGWEKLCSIIKIPTEAIEVSVFIGCDVYGNKPINFFVDDVKIELRDDEK